LRPYTLLKEKTGISLFFFPVIKSVIISAAIKLKVMPLPPKPNAK
jgi:hypothetical protein